ncbi:MAG: cysteine desulfurase family protein [Candidatus Binatus sp.]|uniref:cysteine desulfurase family protein n=1 Tax=Candidatus Binatus sp. TaxID=2811406 RepID=UPI003C78BB00
MAIYLDGHASTPLAPEAIRAMTALWANQANSGSPHAAGAAAAEAIEDARSSVARLIGADASEIIFTSGATEANNLAILGVARAASKLCARRRIVVSAIEHKAVIQPAKKLAEEGFDVVFCPVSGEGRVDLAALEEQVSCETLLVSVMAANNEIGVVQPLPTVVGIARKAGALVHSDAAQAAGKVPIDVIALDLDYLSISAHKMYGPQGVGALYISAAAPKPDPLVYGGGQEGGLRAGTLPAALIAGYGAAAERATASIERDAEHGHSLTRLFLQELDSRKVQYSLLCDHDDRLPGSLALRFEGVDADTLTQLLANTVSITSGSACDSGQIEPSHVLLAIGQSPCVASEFIRIFFGRYNVQDDAAEAAAHFAEACKKVRLATGRVHQ